MYSNVLRCVPEAATHVAQEKKDKCRLAARCNTIFLLDWDDTCCATSHLEQYGMMVDFDCRMDQHTPEIGNALRTLEMRVLSVLKNAVQRGTVVIITNADDEWVELSAGRFMPSVRAFLDYHYKSIKIISARARYIEKYPKHPLMWKTRTFADELFALHQPKYNAELKRVVLHPMNVIVVGDSVGDQYASSASRRKLMQVGICPVVKFVKFLERPSIEQLSGQLGLLRDHLTPMIEYQTSVDICMYKDRRPNQVSCQKQKRVKRHHSTSQRDWASPGTPSSLNTPMASVA